MENKKYDESRIYYVYKHVRLDNNTCFYIGKGKEGRLNVPNRNTIHDNICKKHGYKAVIFKDKLNEEEAFKLEKDLINCYVSKLGYGIYIKGYYVNTENNKFLTNMTFGGEGVSGMNPYANKTPEEMEIISNKKSNSLKGKNKGKNVFANKTEEEMEIIGKKISEKLKGEKNGMFGKNPFANKTPEEMEIIRRKMSEKAKGKNPFANKTEEEMEIISNKISNSMKGKMAGEKNPMFGKNPFANKTPEEMEIIRRKMSEKAKGKNPFANKTEEEMEIIRRKISEKVKGKNAFANKTEEEMEIIGRKISEKVSGEKNGMCGKPSPNRRKVICVTTGKIFDSLKDASNHYKCSHIHDCCKGKLKSAGKLPDGTPLQWEYLENYDN